MARPLGAVVVPAVPVARAVPAVRAVVAQAAVVAVATAGNTRPQPAPTRSLMRFSTAPRLAPAAMVPANHMAALVKPTVASRPSAQVPMII